LGVIDSTKRGADVAVHYLSAPFHHGDKKETPRFFLDLIQSIRKEITMRKLLALFVLAAALT
jgi:hypothetical protein